MPNIDLGFAFDLPPKKAIEYFESKGYKVGFDWQDVWQEAHAKSFTVAGVMKQDILQDIKHSLTDAMKNGESFDQWRNKLEPLLEKKGWLGHGTIADEETGEVSKRLAPHRLETIYRTNMQSAMMAGRYQAQIDNIQFRPYGEYVAVMDNRGRPSHVAMNGIVLPLDDPFWQTFYPPNGFHCRCTVRTRSEADIKRRGLMVYRTTEDDYKTIDQPINKDGDTRINTAFKNPRSGKLFVTDAGFGFNAGAVRYMPDLNKYDTKFVQAFIEESVKGPDFKYMYRKFEHNILNGKQLDSKFKWPVACLNDVDAKLIGTEVKFISASNDELTAHIIGSLPPISPDDFFLVSQTVKEASLIVKSENIKAFVQQPDGIWQATFKTSADAKELLLVSFGKISIEKVAQEIKKGVVIKNLGVIAFDKLNPI